MRTWPVGEMVNTQASQACIHGFKSRTGHHWNANPRFYGGFIILKNNVFLFKVNLQSLLNKYLHIFKFIVYLIY